jgi:RHS repeat-associated protein
VGDRLTSAAAAGGTDGLYSDTYSYDPATGNLAAKGSLSLTYTDSAHPHAATGLSNGNTYAYNAAGSATTRVIGADSYSLAYDSENRLKTVQKNGAALAEFKYDGDGTRVQSIINGVTTRFVGEYYEVTDSVVTKYYGGTAMRVGGTLYYLLSDHLGSNSLILDTTGNVVGETRYTAWGEERSSTGTVSTDYTYTGQYSNTDDFGLMYYKARWYDPVLGRFAQADSVVPDITQPQGYNRYTYAGNNPVKYSDPSGHCEIFCLVVLIGIASFAGGAAVYEFNVSGRSWYESPDDAYATFSAGMNGFVAGVGAALTLGSTAAMVPDAAMYYGASTGNSSAYSWGATQNGYLPPSTLPPSTVSPSTISSTGTSYSKNQFNGRNVYYKDGSFDWNYVDPKTGLTNFERAQKGLAPIGTDGRPMNLHHLLQEEPGPMAEVTTTLHQLGQKPLHGLITSGNSFRNNPSLAAQYQEFRTEYWIWRASQRVGK